MLGTILPYDLEPLRVSPESPVACEVWFVEDADDEVIVTAPVTPVVKVDPDAFWH